MRLLVFDKNDNQKTWPYYLPAGIIALCSGIILIVLFILASVAIRFCKIGPRIYLPMASACAEDMEPDPDHLLIYVPHISMENAVCRDWMFENGEVKKLCHNLDHWKVIIKGKIIDKKGIEDVLSKAADNDRPGGPGTPSNSSIMIRADAGAPYSLVKKILRSAKENLIWKIELAATKPPGSED